MKTRWFRPAAGYYGLLSLILASAAVTRAADFQGQVVDNTTDLPIEGARLTLDLTPASPEVDYEDASSAFGLFRIQDVAAGAYALKVKHGGYLPLEEPFIAEGADVSRIIRLVRTASPFFDVHLTVHGIMTGLVMADVNIKATPFASASSQTPSGLAEDTKTDPTGYAVFRGLNPGNYEIEVTAPNGWTNHSRRVDLASHSMVTIALLPEKEELPVRVTGMDPTTRQVGPLTSVFVDVAGLAPDGSGDVLVPVRNGITETNGATPFTGLPWILPWEVQFKKLGYTTRIETFTIDPANPQDLEVELDLIAMWLDVTLATEIYESTDLFEGLAVRLEGLKNTDTEGISRAETTGTSPELRQFEDLLPGFYVLTVEGRGAPTPGGIAPTFRYSDYVEIRDEGQNAFTADVQVVSAVLYGQVFAADAKGVANSNGDLHPSDTFLSGQPLYKPKRVTSFEIREAEDDGILKVAERVHAVEVDDNGYFAASLPPARYGLIMAGETDYWGSHVLLTEVTPGLVPPPAPPGVNAGGGTPRLGRNASTSDGGQRLSFPAEGQGWPFYQSWPPAFGAAPPSNGTPNAGMPLELETAEYNLDVYLRRQVVSVSATVGNGMLMTATAQEVLGFKDVDGSLFMVKRGYSELAGDLGEAPGLAHLTPTGGGSSLTTNILSAHPDIITTGGGFAGSQTDFYHFEAVLPGDYTASLVHPRYDIKKFVGPTEVTPPTIDITVPDWNPPGVLPTVNPTDPTYVEPMTAINPGVLTFESFQAFPIDAGITVTINDWGWVEPVPPDDPYYELSSTEVYDVNSGYFPFDYIRTSYTGNRVFTGLRGMPTGAFTFWMNGWYKGSVGATGPSVHNIYSGGPSHNMFDIGEDIAPSELGIPIVAGGGGPGAPYPAVDIMVVNDAHPDSGNIAGATVHFQDGSQAVSGPGKLLDFELGTVDPEDVTAPGWDPVIEGTNQGLAEVRHEIVTTTDTVPREVLKVFVTRQFNVGGTVKEAGAATPIANAQVKVRSRFGSVFKEVITDGAGVWSAVEPFDEGGSPPFYIDVRAPGFEPWRQRYDSDNIPSVESNTIPVHVTLTPLGAGTITMTTFSHTGKFLPGVGRGVRDDALDLVWDVEVHAPPRSFTLMGFDDATGHPGESETITVTNKPSEAYIVNTRGANGNLYDGDNEFVYKPGSADSQATLRTWFADVLLAGSRPSRDKMNIFKGGPALFADAGGNRHTAAGTNRISRLPPGPFRPIVVVRAQSGGLTVHSDYTDLGTESEEGDPDPLMTGFRLPCWMAAILNVEGVLQKARDATPPGVDLGQSVKDGLAAKLLEIFPKGKYVPVPTSAAAEISATNDGPHKVLIYTYSLGMGAREGQDNDGDYSGWKSMLPDYLGLEFDLEASAGLDNTLPGDADYFLAGRVAPNSFPFKLDDFTPDILRFDSERDGRYEKQPSFSAGLKVAGGRKSPNDSLDLLVESDVTATIVAEMDIDLQPVLQFLPGGLGALLKGLDKSELLKLFATFDGGLGVKLIQTWWTTQPTSHAQGSGVGFGDHVHHRSFLGTEIKSTTEAKFGFRLGGGIKGTSGNWMEGSAKLVLGGDTGDFDFDALVATLHSKTGWPYFESIKGQLFIEIEGNANLWLVTLSKQYKQVLADIDFEWTTDPAFTAAPMVVTLSMSTPADTAPPVFDGTGLMQIDGFYPAGSFDAAAASGGAGPAPAVNGLDSTEEALVFTGLNPANGNMTVEVAMRDGGDFGAPVVVAEAAGVLSSTVAPLPTGDWLVAWSEIGPGDMEDLFPPSSVKYAVFSGASWSPPVAITNLSDAAAHVRLAGGALTTLAILHTPDGPDSARYDVDLTDYNAISGTWSPLTQILTDTTIAVFDLQAGLTESLFAYTDGATRLDTISWAGGAAGTPVNVAFDAPFDLSLAADPAGGFALAWASPTNGIQFARYDGLTPAWLSATTAVARVDASEVLLTPLVDGSDTLFLLSWVSGGNVSWLAYRHLDADGGALNAPIVLEGSASGTFTDLRGIRRPGREARIVASLSDDIHSVREFVASFAPPASHAEIRRSAVLPGETQPSVRRHAEQHLHHLQLLEHGELAGTQRRHRYSSRCGHPRSRSAGRLAPPDVQGGREDPALNRLNGRGQYVRMTSLVLSRGVVYRLEIGRSPGKGGHGMPHGREGSNGRRLFGIALRRAIILTAFVCGRPGFGQEAPQRTPLNRFPRMVQEYFVREVRSVEQDGERRRSALKTRADAEAYTKNARDRIGQVFGPWPQRTPLKPRIASVVERDAYKIENIIFESRPRFLVTANLYVPKGRSLPLPGVVGTCGHSSNGKAAELYQQFAQGLARQGYVVLIYDPIGQGERLQYPNEDLKSRIGVGVREHLYAGNQQFLVGEFIGSWRAWDGIRALDYLLTRKEVDPEHVGITGNSGGGTMTTWLCGVESRWTMAAPSCFVTTFLRNLENELPADTEQCPPGALALGLDHLDFVSAMAPKPVIVLAKEKDFFDIRGTEQAFEQLKILYRLLGAEQNISLFTGPSYHGYSQENREAMYRWFNRSTRVSDALTEPDLTLEKDETLYCAPSGQVCRANASTVFEFTKDKSKALASQRKSPLSVAELRRLIPKILRLRDHAVGETPPRYRILRNWPHRGYPRKRWATYVVETEPGIQAVVYRLSDERVLSRPPRDGAPAILYVAHQSSDAELRDEPLIKELIKSEPGSVLYTCDVRGVGESKPDTCNHNSYLSPYGSDYFYAIHSIMLDRPYVGQRTYDVLRVVEWLKANGHTDIHLVGRGWGALPTTFAAILSDDVTRVTLKNAPTSYSAIAESETYAWPLSSLLPNVLKHFDLPDCYEALKEKSLSTIDAWGPDMKPAPAGQD